MYTLKALRIIFLITSLWILVISCESTETSSIRLPNNSYPLKYDLWLKVNLENNSTTFKGHVRIKIKILESTDLITLHSKELKIRNITFTDLKTASKNENLAYKLDAIKDFMIINLPHKALPGDEILLDIHYFGEMRVASSGRDSNWGMRIGTYMENDKTLENYIFTHFEPTHARTCLPCYDEPAIRAIFSLQIVHHSSYNAIANMPVISRNQMSGSDGYVITTFEETPKMQAYILAFVVSKFNYLEVNYTRIPQKIYARNSKVGETNYLLDLVVQILSFFEDYFDFPYTLPKLDHVVAPHFTSGIENWGIIGYSENHMFEDDNLVRIRTIVHEIAHQYFGNLVSPKWWSYLWLNEGLAGFFDREFGRLFFSKEEATSEEFWGKTKLYEKINDRISISFHPETFEEIEDKFMYDVYFKSAAVLKMFYEAIGGDTWRKGMRYYIRDNQYSAAEPSDLHRALQKAIDEDVPGNKINLEFLMKSWEDQAGTPIVSVTLQDGNLKLTQNVLAMGGPPMSKVTDGISKDPVFNIPIAYSTSKNPNFNDLSPKLWMTEKYAEINNFTDDWISINNQHVGYYIVDYDDNLWSGIVEQLRKNHTIIHHIDREWLFISMLLRFEQGRCNNTLPLKMISYLKHEDDYDVIKAADHLIKSVLHKNKGNDDVIKSEMFETIRVIYEKFGNFDDSKSIKDTACDLGVENCVADYINDLIKLLGTSKLDTDFPYCTAIRNANETVFDMFLSAVQKYQEPENIDSYEKYKALDSLACVKDLELFKKVLNIFKDPNWNAARSTSLAYRVTKSLKKSKEREATFLDFLEANMKQLVKNNRPVLSQLLSHADGEIKDEKNLIRFKTILRTPYYD